jgi:hypothetical protein
MDVFGITIGSGSVLFFRVEEDFRFNFVGDDFDVVGTSSPGRVRIISRRSSSEMISIFVSRALFNFASLPSRPLIR